jgi:hypothetical protein
MDAYVEVCKRFEDERIRYVIVGVFGINFYARQVGDIITTGDCDILIPARFPAFRKGLELLAAMGFTLEAGDEPLPILDSVILKGILRARVVVRADRADARVDVCTQIAGARFQQLWANHREFIVEGVNVRVGGLGQLIQSKRTANRPKDALFFEQHKEAIESMLRRQKRGRQ